MLIPIGNRILVRPIEEKTTILLTTTKPSRYRVVSIGEDVKKVNIGDMVYLAKFSITEIEHEKEKFIVVDEDHVLAKDPLN